MLTGVRGRPASSSGLGRSLTRSWVFFLVTGIAWYDKECYFFHNMKKTKRRQDTARIGRKHQVVIPKHVRESCKGFDVGARVKLYSIDDHTLGISVIDEDWVERNYGSMSDAWKGINPIKRLEELRDEWDREF